MMAKEDNSRTQSGWRYSLLVLTFRYTVLDDSEALLRWRLFTSQQVEIPNSTIFSN